MNRPQARHPAGSIPWHVPAIHLTVLWSLAVAQPLFDVLGDAPEFFVARGSQRIDIVIFALGLVFAPPALLVAAETVLATLRPTLARALHTVLVATLTTLLAIQVLKRVSTLSSAAVLLLGFLLAIAATRLYWGRPGVRTFLTALAPAPLVFLAIFLAGPVGRLVFDDVSAASAARVPAGAPVVMVVFDELPVTSLMNPDGRINAQRFPSFARLARRSTWFRNATTVHEETTGAVPALLTGRLPETGRLPVAADHPENLFNLLGGSYRLNVTESITRLCPSRLCPRDGGTLTGRMRHLAGDAELLYLHALLPRSVAARLPLVTETWVNFRGAGGRADTASPAELRSAAVHELAQRALEGDPAASFERFVRGIGPSDRPTLSYLHIMLPHSPWRFLPSGSSYEPLRGRLTDSGKWMKAPEVAVAGRQRHLLQLGYADRLLGRLLTHLDQTKAFGKSMVVVVADHGASFRAGRYRRAVEPATLDEIAFVPFFVKTPGQRSGAVVDRHVRTVDVLPTIADGLDLAVPWQTDGVSALAGEPGPSTIAVATVPGKTVSASQASLLPRRARAVAEQARLLGTGGFDARFFALVPGSSTLIGRTVRVAASDLRPLEVDLATGEHPTIGSDGDAQGVVTGAVTTPDARAGWTVAIAVNGVIGATARTYRADDEVRFDVTPAPWAYRRGENDVRVYRVGQTVPIGASPRPRGHAARVSGRAAPGPATDRS